MKQEHRDPPASAGGEHVLQAQDKPSAPHPKHMPEEAQAILDLCAVKQGSSKPNTQRNIDSGSQKCFEISQYY